MSWYKRSQGPFSQWTDNSEYNAQWAIYDGPAGKTLYDIDKKDEAGGEAPVPNGEAILQYIMSRSNLHPQVFDDVAIELSIDYTSRGSSQPQILHPIEKAQEGLTELNQESGGMEVDIHYGQGQKVNIPLPDQFLSDLSDFYMEELAIHDQERERDDPEDIEADYRMDMMREDRMMDEDY